MGYSKAALIERFQDGIEATKDRAAKRVAKANEKIAAANAQRLKDRRWLRDAMKRDWEAGAALILSTLTVDRDYAPNKNTSVGWLRAWNAIQKDEAPLVDELDGFERQHIARIEDAIERVKMVDSDSISFQLARELGLAKLIRNLR